MDKDINDWKPLTIKEVDGIFSAIPIDWEISGGWALDMHLGRKTRKHCDIDLVIFREDQQVVYQYLKNGWMLYKAKEGKVVRWTEGEILCDVNDIWAKKDEHSLWAFQIMLIDSEQNNWVYRREKMIKI